MPTRLYAVIFDSADHVALARWWSEALGWPVTYEAADEVVIEPSPENDTVPALGFVPVPEPKSGKNRVHLDLATDSAEHQAVTVRRLVDIGATRTDIGQEDVPWVVLADPEGNELCVLEPRDRYRGKGPLAAIVLDVGDPARAARFWSIATGWKIGYEHKGVASLHNPSGELPDLDLVAVNEPHRVKNRVHLDVAPLRDDDLTREVRRLVVWGARRVEIGQSSEVTWQVLADPDGNEFCVLSPR